MKARYLLMALGCAALMVMLVPPSRYATVNAFSGTGSGTVGDPYIIENVDALQEMKDDNTACYALGNDIDASATTTWNAGAGFVPVGGLDNAFTGSFDGRGYKITGLFINRPATWYVGLFGYIENGGVVENVGMENVDVTASGGGSKRVGGLVGYNIGTVANSYSTGSITSSTGVGGLVGRNIGTVDNSYSTGSVSGGDEVGGLIGYNAGVVKNSYSTGSASGANLSGGLVGYHYGASATITKSYSTGAVTVSDEDVGGLVGAVEIGTVTNSYSTGSVSGVNHVGGLVGYIYDTGTVSNSFWNIKMSGKTTSAGGTGKTVTEMRTQSTFTGWDFENIWAVDPDPHKSYGFPYLIALGTTATNISPEVTITAPPDGYDAKTNEGVQYTASGTDDDGDALTYLWDFGGAGTMTGPSVTFAFGSSGDYTVTATVTDNYAASGTDTIVVNVTTAAIPEEGGGGGGGGWGYLEPSAGPIQELINAPKNLLFITSFLGMPMLFWLAALGATTYATDHKGIAGAVALITIFLIFFGSKL